MVNKKCDLKIYPYLGDYDVTLKGWRIEKDDKDECFYIRYNGRLMSKIHISAKPFIEHVFSLAQAGLALSKERGYEATVDQAKEEKQGL